ncbi:hypothetical protein OpiT1DRAFT_03701 [Opitutaceae bacterium TAV1]|nr:hypothetical protein OpiT1DRAFT_03701 [Opitutaceae bacterium TAV1]
MYPPVNFSFRRPGVSVLGVLAFSAVSVFSASPPAAAWSGEDAISLSDGVARLAWSRTAEGWMLIDVGVRSATSAGEVLHVGDPSGRYTLLYSATEPDITPETVTFAATGKVFPEKEYHANAASWKTATSPALLNTVGEAFTFFPANARRVSLDATIVSTGKNIDVTAIAFTHQTPVADLVSTWQTDPAFPGDFLVTLTLTARKAGWFSMATPALVTLAPQDLAWALVPGYFKGDRLNPDLPLALAYGHGLPARPVIVAERTATTPASIATHRSGATLTVLAAPGEARDPWPAASDKHALAAQRLGLSHMTRAGQLSPTLYYPVLGKTGSRLEAGEHRAFHFRYSLRHADWFAAIKHAANDIYGLQNFLALKRPVRSLSDRLHALHRYVIDDATSLWHTADVNGLTIGAQEYNGLVVGAKRNSKIRGDYDALKNSDYGAMWMLARLTGDPRLVNDRLPQARAFKLAQQQTAPGFYQGAATGQYYLTKSRRFTEEYGDYVEPIAITYYTLLDMGNILLFDPADAALCERLRLGADRLLAWQRPDGSWPVAYDHKTRRELFTETPDLRPTFYGLLVAHRILGGEKNTAYLDAARRGADWLLENAVKPARFLGVCGDNRFAPDFATAQLAQALLDLHDATGDTRYRDAGIECARQYITEIYTHPAAADTAKTVAKTPRRDWEINMTGLAFEHGGAIGSANRNGPILLASHAGLLVRVSQLTGEPFYRDLARAGVLARDAFLNPKNQVASYYWAGMNAGAGGFPHHAWWQLGWITDYLVSEIRLRSGDAITFPRGFITPKVGPHASFGFALGVIHGQPAHLAWAEIDTGRPDIDYLVARSPDARRAFVILLNNSPRPVQTTVKASPLAFAAFATFTNTDALARAHDPEANAFPVELPAWGLAVLTLDLP